MRDGRKSFFNRDSKIRWISVPTPGCVHTTVVSPHQLTTWDSPLWLSVFWAPALRNAAILGLSYSVPDHWKLVSARSLLITFEDFVSCSSSCVSGAWKVLAVSLYPDNDYWMWRKAAKKQKGNRRTVCKVRFVTFSTFLFDHFIVWFH